MPYIFKAVDAFQLSDDEIKKGWTKVKVVTFVVNGLPIVGRFDGALNDADLADAVEKAGAALEAGGTIKTSALKA